MAKKRVAINGFGRIGRCALRIAMPRDDYEIVAVNDLTDTETLAYLLKYDSLHGTYKGEVNADGEHILVDGRKVLALKITEPEKLPWKDLGVDLVIESTGRFVKTEECAKHLAAGASRVLLSAPAKGDMPTVVYGINEKAQDYKNNKVFSNASCTTNCLAPVAKVLHDNFGIEWGAMTTVHSYTNDQKLLDLPHKDLRRARAAALNMIPTSTGAAKAVGLVLPELKGKLNGVSIRVPTADVSIVDLTVQLAKDTTAQAINEVMKAAAAGPLKGCLRYCGDPLVSGDFRGDVHASIFDAGQTMMVGPRLAKVMSWYDNEWGFTARMCEFAGYLLKQ